MAGQAVGLSGQPGQPGPPPGQALATGALNILAHLAGIPAFATAGHPLDLSGRQPERLAELANRPARPVGGKGGDERRALAPIALVDTRDELLPDVPREVEVDVRQRGQLVVE